MLCLALSLGSSWSVGSAAFAAGPATPAPTSGGSTTYGPSGSAFSLTVSPTRLSIAATEIGARHEVLVVNRGTTPITVDVQKRNFTSNASGALTYSASAPYAAAAWLAVSPAKFVIQPGTSQSVTATVTMPVDPEPGDHQVALVFLVPAGVSSSNVRINRGVAAPVYITVPGPVDTSVRVDGLRAAGFSTGGSVPVSAVVHNVGTVHRDFRGASPMMLSGTGGATAFPDFTVLRDSTREMTTQFRPPLMCICHTQIFVRNADGITESASMRIIVFPVIPAVAIVAALLLAALLIVVMRRRYQGNVRRAATRSLLGSGQDGA